MPGDKSRTCALAEIKISPSRFFSVQVTACKLSRSKCAWSVQEPLYRFWQGSCIPTVLVCARQSLGEPEPCVISASKALSPDPTLSQYVGLFGFGEENTMSLWCMECWRSRITYMMMLVHDPAPLQQHVHLTCVPRIGCHLASFLWESIRNILLDT